VKRTHWDYNKAAVMFKDYFKGADAQFDFGVMGHYGTEGWWLPKTLYKGAQKNMDVYRLIALHAQKNVKVYTGDAADEEAAKLITRKAHEKRMREALEKMKALYKGKGEVLHRTTYFGVTTMHKRTQGFSRPVRYGTKNARAGVQYVVNWAFNTVVKKEAPQHFIFYVANEGLVFYCSEKEFNDVACSQMIGYTLYSRYMQPPKELVDPFMRKNHKDYIYYAIVQNTANEDGKGIQDAVRVNLSYSY